MANLSVEGLNKVIQTGDTEALFGRQEITRQDKGVAREMESNGLQTPAQPGATTFTDMLRNSMDKVNTFQVQADTAIKELVAGRTKNIHETMLAIERADTSLKLMMQIRNKILDGYREIMRMQV